MGNMSPNHKVSFADERRLELRPCFSSLRTIFVFSEESSLVRTSSHRCSFSAVSWTPKLQVSHVVHFDMPEEPDLYLHRAGRTGRMGRPGTVLTLADPAEIFVLRRLGNSLGITFREVPRRTKG